MTGLTPGRDAGGQFVRTFEAAERDAEAAKLKSSGWSYSRLAQHYKVSKRSAIEMVKRGFAGAGAQDREEARARALTEIAALRDEAWTVLKRRHITVNNGRVIRHPDTEEPLEDDAPVLAALTAILRLQEREAKVLGIDAPTRHDVKVQDSLDADIERLVAQLAVGAQAPVPRRTRAAKG